MILTLASIAYQDIKDRLVFWFLYLLTAILGGYFFLENTFTVVYLYFVAMNMAIIGALILLIGTYVKFIVKKPFFKDVFGFGEVLIILALAVSFPTVSFLVILFFSTIFSLALQLVLFRLNRKVTIPAAGYISIFLIGVYLVSWSGLYNELYLL